MKLSHSAVEMYNNCTLCYKLHFIENIRPKAKKSALIWGGVLDKSFNDLLINKDLAKARTLFVENWAKNVNITYSKSDLDQELLGFYKNPTPPCPEWSTLNYKGQLFIETYYNEILPRIKEVIAVQEPISIKNAEGDEIRGNLDLIVKWKDGKNYLIDNKSSSVKYTELSPRENDQLPLYYYGSKDKYKLDGIGYIVLNKKINKNREKTCKRCGVKNLGQHKTCNENSPRCGGEFDVKINPTVDTQIILTEVQESDTDRVLQKMDDANYGISNNHFADVHNPKFGKYGPCTYYDYYEGSPDFYKQEKK